MSVDRSAWVPIGLLQHHAEVHTDMVYTWTLEGEMRDRYKALVGRPDPGKLRVSLSEIIARFEALRCDSTGEEVTMKRVVELFIQDHFDLDPCECLVELCVACCPQSLSTT